MGDYDLSSLPTDALKQLFEETSQAVTKLKRKTAFMNFMPLPFQREWFESTKKIRVLLCGNRTGKTTFGRTEVLSACLGVKPKALGGAIPPGGWAHDSLEGKKFLACGETFETVFVRTIVPKLEAVITPDMLKRPPRKNQQGFPCEYHFVTGAKLSLMSYQQPVKLYEGAAWHGVWWDEPPPQEIRTATKRGMMETQGWELFTCTLIDSGAWILDEIVLPSQDEDHPLFGAVDYFRAETERNCLEHHGGYLPHDEIVQWEAQLSPRERNARLLGIPMEHQGMTFGYVRTDTHVVNDFDIPLGWPVVEVVDPSYTRGLFVGWFTCDPDDYWYWVRAANIEEAALSAQAREIQRHRAVLRREPVRAIMDARGGAHKINKEEQRTWFQEFALKGLKYLPSQETRLPALHEWMRPEWNPRKDAILPKLRLTKSVACLDKGPLWAFQRFIWNPLDSKPKQYKQAGKDWVDLARYLAGFQNLTWERLGGVGRDDRREARTSLAATFATRRGGANAASRLRPQHLLSRQRAASEWMRRIQPGYTQRKGSGS